MYSSGMSGACTTLAIASHLSELSTGTSFLVITDLPVFGRFRLPPNLDYIHIPRLSGGVESSDEPTSRFESNEPALAIRSRLIAAAIESFEPHLVIVDRWPLGIENELEEPLYALRERNPMTRIVVGLWDVASRPHTMGQDRSADCVCDTLHDLYDEIWLYGVPESHASKCRSSTGTELAHKAHFMGYLRHVMQADGSQKLASEAIDAEQPLVLVTVGCGSNGYRLLDEYLNFLEEKFSSDVASFQTHIVCGPMMSTAEKKGLDDRVAALESVSIHRFHKDLNPYINAASVVVSTAGYNTCCQILSHKKRAIVVPRSAENREQMLRAEFLSERGLIEMIHPDELCFDKLGAMVLEQLREFREEPNMKDFESVSLDGLENIAKRVIEYAPTFTR